MRSTESDRTKACAKRIALSALFALSSTAVCFAQEPPLDVARAGAVPGLASSGCDPGLIGGGLYGNANMSAGPRTAGNNTASDLGVPLYGSPDAGANIPLYSNPLAGDNVPLYSSPSAGSNIPLFSNGSLYGNTRRDQNSALYGAVNNPSGPITCRSGIPIGEWLIYPSIRLYSEYSDNLFLAPSNGINGFGFGASPTINAQWTNGIHSTTIYANVDTVGYPTHRQIDAFDRQATFTQKYSPLPDLTFSVLGDYRHQTVTGSLINSIPQAVTTPVTSPTLLPNGNIELPNGTIVSPTGQVVGNINGPSGATGISLVNPYDQYTGTASLTKIFNRGIVTLSASTAQTDYSLLQNAGTPTAFSSFSTKTFTENSSFWLGPVFYGYSEGTYSIHTNAEGINANSGHLRPREAELATRQFDLVRGSVYFGYHGSNSDGSGSAGGLLYGGKFSYYPNAVWTITAAIDETINHAPGSGAISNLALAVDPPEQIPLSSSTRITRPSLQSQYQISPQWSLVGNFSYNQIDYYGSPRLDHAWQADMQLSYEMWRNMTLTWEYSFTNVLSNAPGQNALRNLVMMSANYRF